jgi:L-asparaginase
MLGRLGKRVMMLHTGGTLGMVGSPLEPGDFLSTLAERVPELGQIARIETRVVCNLDSADIGPAEWARLATIIAEVRPHVDGVVVIHGTDTMAYTASALSFALPGLDMPVVLTGAQRPLGALRTDARRNLQDAVEVATGDLCEVGICFDGRLFRGCRAVKNDAWRYRAFSSPGLPPLGEFGLEIDIASFARTRPSRPFRCVPEFDDRVVTVYVHPGMDSRVLERMLEGPEVKGVVLAALGVGNLPTRTRPLAPAVRKAVDRGIDVLVVTQWGGGVRLGAYATSSALRDAGAMSGGHMRIQAAVPKLMHAIANHSDPIVRRAYIELDVAGELE